MFAMEREYAIIPSEMVQKEGGYMESVIIRTLGEFSLQAGEKKISDRDNRTKKVWLLLAYLICQRGRAVSQKKLIDQFWGEDEGCSNPENALRITFHRLRGQLDQLWPGAGRELILHKDGGYIWNDQVPMVLDCDRFDQLCNLKTEDEEQRLDAMLEALELYGGDFLTRQSSEVWVIPISTHFHNLYVSAALTAAGMLSQRGRHKEAAQICRRAIAAEPYHESLHQLLMKELAAAGDQKGAGAVYDALSRRLFDDFGIRPSEETKAVYREAVHAPSETSLSIDMVLEHLQEPNAVSGAMQCDYDYFKVLCYAESRAMERSGTVTHVVLLSVAQGGERPLTRRSLNRIMDQLGEQIRTNLRRGDTFSRCSVHQYIIMLPKANYENSCMVCRRVLGAFNRAHPNVTAKVNYMVQPLGPSICVP